MMTQPGESDTYCERVANGFARHPFWCHRQCGLCRHVTESARLASVLATAAGRDGLAADLLANEGRGHS